MKSNTCPRCKAHMHNVVLCLHNGSLLKARCDACDWTGTKRKKGH